MNYQPEGGELGASRLPAAVLDVVVIADPGLVDVAVRAEDGPAVAAGCDPPVSVGGAHLSAPHHRGGDRGDGEALGGVTQPSLQHVNQADRPAGVVAAQRAEEEDEGVAAAWRRVDRRGVRRAAKPLLHLDLLSSRDVNSVAGAVCEKALVNVDVYFFILLLRLVYPTFICRLDKWFFYEQTLLLSSVILT